MKSSEDLAFRSFKSKKILHSSSSKASTADADPDPSSVDLDQLPWSSKTPEKSTIPSRSARNHLTIFSMKDVSEAAKLRQSRQRPCIKPGTIISDGLQTGRSSVDDSSPRRAKKADKSPVLPERYAILGEFFDRLVSSIRLLRGSTPSFSNIRPKIESFTNRRFTYSHLAQLKFILPEAIQLKKILTRDELTFCMKADLHITLNTTAIMKPNQQSSESGHMCIRNTFRDRLLDYFMTHPEGDVPEETLPEPFNKSKKHCVSEAANSTFGSERSSVPPAIQQPVTASHLSKSSFRSFFSVKASGTEALTSPPLPVAEKTTVENVFPEKTTVDNDFPEKTASSSSLPATPLKEKVISKDVFNGGFTPGKFICTPSSATPEMMIPKRCFTTPDNEPSKLVRRPPRNRTLVFDTPVKSQKNVDEVKSSFDSELSDILPDSVLQSIREKELKAIEERDPAISQAKWRRQMISRLPKIFDMIVCLYHSIQRSVLTKNDLIHKIISSHLNIVDRREVEEQIKLLQEIAPEWIYEKLASTGDLLICINKISNPESIRTRLTEAK